MKLIFKYSLCFILVIVGINDYAQNNEIDSLKRVLRIVKEDTNKVFLLNKIARQFFLNGEYDSSLFYAKKNGLLAQKLVAENPASGPLNFAAQKGVAMSYNVTGLTYSSMGDYQVALNNFNAFLEISQKISDKKGIAAAYGNIGNVYHEQGRYPESLKRYLLTLKIREEINDRKGMANSYVSLGNVYSIMHNYTPALQFYSKAVKLFEEFGDKHSLSGTYSNIAGIYTSKGYYDQALKMYWSYLEIMKEFNDPQSIASTYGNIGNIYIFQKQYSKALQQYLEALKIQEEIDDTPGLSVSYINVGQAYIKLKDFKKAESFVIKGLELSKSGMELESLRQAYGTLNDLYEKTGNYKKALDNYKLNIIYRDSITNEENTEQATRIEMNYEFDKKNAANKLEQGKKEEIAVAERKKQQIIIWSVCAILFLVLCFAIFVYRSFLQKQKAHIEITQQKHIIEEKQKEILDSIYYARRIQRALLTSEKYIERNLNKFIKKQ